MAPRGTDFVKIAEILYHVQIEVEVEDRSLIVRLVGFDSCESPVVSSKRTGETWDCILNAVHFVIDVEIGPIGNYLVAAAAERYSYLSQRAAEVVNESFALHLQPVQESG